MRKKVVFSCILALLMVLVVAAPLALCATSVISCSFNCWSLYTSSASYSLTWNTDAGCEYRTHASSVYTGSGTASGYKYFKSYISRDTVGAFYHGFSNIAADGTVYKKAFGNPITADNYFFIAEVVNRDQNWRISGASAIVRP